MTKLKVPMCLSSLSFCLIRHRTLVISWNHLGSDIGVEHHKQSNQASQDDAVLEHSFENGRFVSFLMSGSARNHDALCIDHLAHDAACAVGRSHQDRTDA